MAQNKQKLLICITASQVRDSWSTVSCLIVPKFLFQNLPKKTVCEKFYLCWSSFLVSLKKDYQGTELDIF